MNFGNLEKIEEVILQPARSFSIKNVVTLGKRNTKTGNRYDCLQVNTYKSNKYTDYNYLASISIQSSDFLVFAYRNYESKQLTEVYSSYQHIQDIREAFTEVLETMEDAFLVDEDSGVITLTSDAENYDMAINGLVNNNSIHLIFDVDYDEERVSNKYQKAVTILLNEEKNCVTVTEENLKGIVYFLNHFDLLSSSQHLKQMAFMYQIANSLDLENKDIKTAEYSYGTGGSINEESKPKRKIVKKKSSS